MVVPAAKNATSKIQKWWPQKNHPKDILHNKNYLYGGSTSSSYIKFCIKNILNLLKITITPNFVKLPHCLTTFASLDTKQNIIQP